MSNFTYADTAGHVLYRWNAMLPRRADETADYSLDVDASDPRRLWTGLHRPADLPRLLDPPGGYIQNANNAPWWTSLRDRLDPGRYPAHLERDPPSLRAQGILRQLEARTRWSPADMIAAKYDTRVVRPGACCPTCSPRPNTPGDDSGALRGDRHHGGVGWPAPMRAAAVPSSSSSGNATVPARYAHRGAPQHIDTPSGRRPGRRARRPAAAAAIIAEHGRSRVGHGAASASAIDLPADGAPAPVWPVSGGDVVGQRHPHRGTTVAPATSADRRWRAPATHGHARAVVTSHPGVVGRGRPVERPRPRRTRRQIGRLRARVAAGVVRCRGIAPPSRPVARVAVEPGALAAVKTSRARRHEVAHLALLAQPRHAAPLGCTFQRRGRRCTSVGAAPPSSTGATGRSHFGRESRSSQRSTCSDLRHHRVMMSTWTVGKKLWRLWRPRGAPHHPGGSAIWILGSQNDQLTPRTAPRANSTGVAIAAPSTPAASAAHPALGLHP
jgi:hypothetical protein